ncbi:MAG TPA: HAMP domain-containing sensor histidine kinase [Roseiarcus sp.]
MIRQAFARLGLAARIGAAIAAAVIAIQILVTLVFVLHPPNLHALYSARWLSGAAVEIIRNALAGAREPTSALGNLPNGESLTVRFDRAPPPRASSDPPWPLNRVLATVRSELGGPAAPAVEAVGMGPGEEAISVVPADASLTLPSGPLQSGEDLLTPPFFLIAADLHDGRWLTIEPSFRTQRRRLMLSLAFIFGGMLLIAAIAVLTARSLIAPLSQLATAADALGRSGEIVETPRPAVREFAAIHSAFDTMQKRLKRFVSERTQMLASISHDLRTPLTRLRLQAEYVADNELREGMLANIDAMRDMLTETLSFAEGDASADASAPFDLASILISLCDEASDAGAQAEYDGPNHVTAFGKRTAIRRMVSNLIDNAVRYGGAARVSLREDATDWIVTVADDGPGIPPESFDSAFEPFQRLESSRNRETGGTGLGLSIARDIVLAHGGRISLANASPNSGGLVVSVLLPKALAAAS